MKAQTLRQLFAIREDNRVLLDGLATWGTALGRKNGDGDAAILVYVPQKIGEPWLPSGQAVPKTLAGADGTACPTDVIAGSSDRHLQLRVFDRWETDYGLRPLGELVATNPVIGIELELRDRLRGSTSVITPGCQLAFRDEAGSVLHGTLACFARDKQTKRVGLLTNQHIGKFPGNVVAFPDVGSRPLGVFRKGVLDEPVEDRYGRAPADTLDPWQSRIRLDAGFCEFHPSFDMASNADPRLPMIEDGKLHFRPLGSPFSLDLDSMDPVGAQVVGVGRTRSFQRGTIQAFSFEFLDSSRGVREYNDFLIVGDGNNEFSAPGDSGKLVVLEKGIRP